MRKIIDETGKKYGKLTVLESAGRVNGRIKWKCQCECGKITYVNGYFLRDGQIKSCGCDRGRKVKDITGQKFNRLTAKEYVGNKLWLCICDCGNEFIVRQDSLTLGRTKSCGCMADERTPYKKLRTRQEFPRLYRIWRAMKERCYREKSASYRMYGAKGIKVCDEWRKHFDKFFEWAIQNGYKEVEGEFKDCYSIDRIDSSKDYYPENCRWITLSENSQRVSKINVQLEELKTKTDDKLVQEYIERKIANNQEIQETKQKIRSGFFFCRKNTYCIIKNDDGTRQFLFKNLSIVADFLQISRGSLYYRRKQKNGVLNETWKIEDLTKEQFDEIKSKGIEVIV